MLVFNGTYLALNFKIWFHSLLRYIRRSHQASIKKFYHHSLLSSNPCHSTMYILKLTLCNHYFIS